MACTLHPYVASAGSEFHRLVRACFWQAVDPDWRHSAYWREQVEQCQGDFLASFVVHPNWPADVAERRRVLHRDQTAVAFRTGYELATKRRALSVTVPGFQSGSLCNTRTLSNGLDIRGLF